MIIQLNFVSPTCAITMYLNHCCIVLHTSDAM